MTDVVPERLALSNESFLFFEILTDVVICVCVCFVVVLVTVTVVLLRLAAAVFVVFDDSWLE